MIHRIDDPQHVIDLARWLPDVPAWVDVRGALLCGRSTVFTADAPGAFVIATPHAPLACIVGHPVGEVVYEAIDFILRRAGEAPVLLADDSLRPQVEAWLPDWQYEAAIMHALPESRQASRGGRRALAQPEADVRWIEPGAGDVGALLARVPLQLREELLDASGHTVIACAWVEGRPVAFAHSPWSTERWFDISVETLETHRRRGLGEACARALMARLTQSGLRPVWGAMAGNDASRALAARLGFEPVAQVATFQRAADADDDGLDGVG